VDERLVVCSAIRGQTSNRKGISVGGKAHKNVVSVS